MDKQWLQHLPLEDVKDIIPVSGGDVNEAYRVETNDETFFLLVQRQRQESFYAAEIAGLNEFERANITAPRVIASGEVNGDAYLVLSYLEEGTTGSQRQLGQLVAKMHSEQQEEGRFGFSLPYEGGDISFDNHWQNSWSDLFVNQRMDHLRDELMTKGLWNEEDNKVYKQVRAAIVTALANHRSKPSLLHGDLWGGNYMFLTDGSPALFDPAPLYGDREFDIGITTVFGGFTNDFYDEYNKHYPLAKGSEYRLEFYRLYLLMVHLLKLGDMYRSSVERSMATILQQA
ncbi:fructosamine kinase family protein [Staphylococcus simiae]|uniref:fructosamine kinase family protein n=1 Tax=Staphylococcus simiae TaxID=308354 RepID=UPI001A97B5AD|nr:fructosamine kinase family protein [Staphylococcus simiae]MBO1198202.1 fructosamine kinase family protein [Staphylococcus simiae]MBO1200254.1 fructosamine kinase family protein [Staphylococcus simiae]MBO1202582.1 fructosamine kinase family protein [Staphylococcus simiae]MBO1210140.1 fructosamine kinase family protein [Staphylococcus simiae]MBO1228726.1 fructosamine kinase family protein [Staphylococcus simiae]